MTEDNLSRLGRIVLVGLLAGCAVRTSRVPAANLPVHDGGTLSFDEPVRIAVIGGGHADGAGPDLVSDVTAWDPHLVVLLGDLAPRSTAAAWQDLHVRWAPLAGRLLPVAGASERRGDPDLRGLHAAFPGLGVPELDGAFWHFELVHDEVRWRLVLLDLGLPDDRDERFWVPKVVSGDDYDRLLIAAGHSLDDAHAGYLDLVRDHADPSALTAVLAGGTDTVTVALPEGRYGPLHLEAGPGGRGWWPLVVDGGELELVYRELTAAGPVETTRIRATAAAGWVGVP